MEFIQENAWIIVAVMGGLIILFKFAMWVQRVNSDRETFKDFMKEIREDIKNINNKLDKVIGRIDKIDRRIDKIETRIDTIEGRIDTIDRRINKIDDFIDRNYKGTFSSESPIHLNELGEKISGEIQARQWAEKTATEFIEKVKDKQPYEIQEMCFEHIQKTFKPDSELDAKIGTAAYEHGIKRDKVLAVLVIELRDVLLKSIKQAG